MSILINNAVTATQIFLLLFVLLLIFTLRKKTETGFSMALTQELKGLAILAIIFAHIGYFLVSDNRFLFPLSIAAGVGVNLFLFLSGYGLTISALKKPLSLKQFYSRRLLKLYQPFWLVILVFLGLDFLIIGQTYNLGYIGQSLLGFFPRADLWLDLNSPLWYFSFIVFYYLLFPFVFSRRYPWLSALILYLAGYFLIFWNPEFIKQVIGLYRLHTLAFPLGVLVAALVFKSQGNQLIARLKLIWSKRGLKFLKQSAYWVLLIFLLSLIVHSAYYSHVGDLPGKEQATSLITSGAIIIFFLIQKFSSRLLYWFGFYSYEIYLLHWPIMSRFDIFYFWAPAWLATLLYLAFFLGIAWLLRYLINRPKPSAN